MAYAQRLGSRLASDTARVTAAAEAGTGAGPAEAGDPDLLPVLAARDMAVTDTAERMFPETTTTRVRGATDLDGWTHGTAAADRARMGGNGPELRGGRGRR